MWKRRMLARGRIRKKHRLVEEKVVEKEPAEELQLAAVADAMIDPIIIFDLDGNTIHVNPALIKATGYESEELIGKHITEIRPLFTSEGTKKIMPLIKECLKSGGVGPFEMDICAKDGGKRTTSFTASVLKDAGGNPKNILMLMRDITEARHLMEKLESAYKELAVLERARVLTFILFKDIFEPLLRKCKPETVTKVRDQIRSIGERVPIVAGLRVKDYGTIGFDEPLICQALVGLSPRESTDKIVSTFSEIMDVCYPLLQADVGYEKITAAASKIFSRLFEEPRTAPYKPELLRVVPNGVELLGVYRVLDGGKGYLVEEKTPEHAFRMFSNMTAYGFPGLFISTTYPSDVKREYELMEKATVLWLSKAEREYAISPSNLGILRDRISAFVSENENAVVLLDGIEYLATMNGFDLTLKFLHDVRETIMLNRARLIVPIAPVTLEPKQMELLERYMEVIEVVEEEKEGR